MNHLEENLFIPAPPEIIFAYADNFHNFSAHMNESSMMMAGSKMETITDEGNGQIVGSHIKMTGKVLGIILFLDEVITIHDAPHHKEWQTVGDINLLVIDHYTLGFEITPEKSGSRFKVYIDYNLPKTFITNVLGQLFGGIYARWCIRQMIDGVSNHFAGK